MPIVLTTNTYVETGDRELARRVGADDLVIRTPELREAIDALRRSLQHDDAARSSREVMTPEIERERMRRVVCQLEKQVAMNSALMQRCAALSAEISVLSGISGALAQGEDVDAALEGALAACLDAGGVSRGALYVFDEQGDRARTFGIDGAALESFVKDGTHLRALVADRRSCVLAGAAESGVLVPLFQQREPIGALLLVMSNAAVHDQDRLDFAESVANQIALALVLTRTFNALIRSERDARAQAALLRSTLDSIGDGVIAVDGEGHVTHLNPAASRMTNATLREGAPMASASFELYRGDRTTRVTQAELPLARALDGVDVPGEELFLRHDALPDGLWLSASARPVRDGAAARGAVLVFRDVSTEKQAQTQLMISDRLASLGILAAGVAHEISNPLAAILANVDCARAELKTIGSSELDSVSEALDDAQEAAHRLRVIVRDLKAFSRVDDDVEPIDLTAAMDTSLRLAWNEVRHRAVVIKDYGDDLPRVRGNDARVGQVFLNLIINATHAMTGESPSA
ncbi:MAG TPA: histidine kinase dimerization/phospho-acceptor domain-containing protein, partial [Polyangiaceae bacterium]